MFNNIGGKIKGLVQIIFWIEAVAAVIAGLSYAGDTMGFSILIAAFGILILWISTWIIYGYGEIIETLTEIEKLTRGGGLKGYGTASSDSSSDPISDAQARNYGAQVRQLQEQKAAGLITEEEYNARKAQLKPNV